MVSTICYDSISLLITLFGKDSHFDSSFFQMAWRQLRCKMLLNANLDKLIFGCFLRHDGVPCGVTKHRPCGARVLGKEMGWRPRETGLVVSSPMIQWERYVLIVFLELVMVYVSACQCIFKIHVILYRIKNASHHLCCITMACYVYFQRHTRCFVSVGLKLRMPAVSVILN